MVGPLSTYVVVRGAPLLQAVHVHLHITSSILVILTLKKYTDTEIKAQKSQKNNSIVFFLIRGRGMSGR